MFLWNSKGAHTLSSFHIYFVLEKKFCTVRLFPHASNHKPGISNTFVLTFHLDPSFLQCILFCFSHYTIKGGRESLVCVTTGYGLDGPWIESRWGARFFTPVQTYPGATQLPVKWVRGVFPVSKASVASITRPHLVPK